MGYISGIDVSHYQPTNYSTSGHSFVFVKATEGTSYTSPSWGAQVDHGRAAGLVVGHYHFGRSGSIAEADYFLATIKGKLKAGDVLIFDWEDSSISCAEKDAWLKHVKAKAPGHRVLLYCNSDYQLHHNSSGYVADGLWVASYSSAGAGHPTGVSKWLIHQYTDRPLDTSVAQFATAAAMRTWAGGAAKPPAPAKPKVDLSNLIRAVQHYPKSPAADSTKLVQRALHAEGLYFGAIDGKAGLSTRAGYAKWQRRCGYTSPAAADGIPGKTSLTKLGQKHGFTVVA